MSGNRSQPLTGSPQLCLFWTGHINLVILHAVVGSGFLHVARHFFFLTDLSIFILTLFSGAAGSGQRILTLSPPGRAAQTSAGPLNHGLNLWLFHTLIQQEQFCMPFPSFNYKVCPHSFSGGNNRNWGNLYSGRPLTHSPHGVPHPLSSGSSEWETRT